MKKIVKYLILIAVVTIAVVSCIRVEPVKVDYGYFVDSYRTSDNKTVVLECSVDSFLEGESMVHVKVRNTAWDQEERMLLQVGIDAYLTTNDFQRELRTVKRRSGEEATTSFCTRSKGLEISWKMFDEIYKKYYTWQ